MDNQKSVVQKQRAENRKFHILYKTTCAITNKFYIGMHSTDDLNDGYLGSGQILSKSIKKYGKENHICEVLEYHTDRITLANREKDVITPELRKDLMCMNISAGGFGNYLGRPTKDETRQKMSVARKGKPKSEEHKAKIGNAHQGKKVSEESLIKWREKNVGRIQSDEEKKMRSEAAKKKPNYNARIIVVNGVEYDNFKVASESVDIPYKTIWNRVMSTSEKFKEYYFKE